ncbi:peptide ABC transporter substrate-binding protein [Photobacterium sp. TY1-4]|uniref:peptide ABC transporter substrate-binding protein n=1 Tax=Photobacterium sp. TY1-4 TaxID=2899122 RepID=UPI0021BF1A3A|nr:peptide ABC transporter substrate-binding protein [Photobacterium sp. TY1-4]UXI02842.1 peptide ABC transporter substrate-binding protein [Photobacterium sp. TY1-4]
MPTLSALAAEVPSGVALAKEQYLVRANGAEPNTLDPGLVGSGSPGDVIVNDLFEGLVIENLQGETIPGQAAFWTISKDGQTITFKLRDQLQWSDGSPLTAQDFVYAWRRAVDPSTGNTTSFYFQTANVLNAEAIIAGEKPASTLGVQAPDDGTLVITLARPTPYFLSLMSIKTFFPVPRAVVEQYGDAWTRAEHFVSNGAYVLKQWVPNEKVEVVRNPHYRDNETTVIDGVTYLALSSQNAELTRYRAGEIDMTNRVQLEYYQKLKQTNPEQIKALRLLGSYVYAFNTRVAPFDNPDIRRALNLVIDRQLLVEKVTGQGEPPAYSVVPDIIPGYQAPEPAFASQSRPEKLAQARELLSKAGYSQAKPLTVKLTYNTSENHKKIALAIASMWKQLGVKVELENMEWNAYLAAKSTGDFTVARSYAFGDFAEPSSVLESFTCGHVGNESGFCNQTFDRLLNQAANTPEKAQRYALFSQAEQILLENSPVIPLYHYNHTRLVRSSLQGFPENNPKGNIYAKDMYFIAQ